MIYLEIDKGPISSFYWPVVLFDFQSLNSVFLVLKEEKLGKVELQRALWKLLMLVDHIPS